MESSGLVDDFLSPESTVTSLMSSSGHLRSSLRPPEHNTFFRYRDKDFDSASAALDAYITDFERSHHDHSSLETGRLFLPHNPLFTPRRPKVHTLRNKDGMSPFLRERLTDTELDFLNLPVSSLQRNSNHDRLSMTTDELLSVPYDGTMPVTHTTAFLQGLLPQSGASRPGHLSSRPEHRVCARLGSNQAVSHYHSLPISKPRSSRCRCRPGEATFKPDVFSNPYSSSLKTAHRGMSSERPEPSSSLHLPLWLTSNKADMDLSGITSMPDLKYPAWIQSCDIKEPELLTQSERWDDHSVLPRGASRNRAPSWVVDLENDDDPRLTLAEVDSQLTLRDLRHQCAEQMLLLASDRKGSDTTSLLRDNRIDSLIQKADQVLNSLSQSLGKAESAADTVSSGALSQVNTEELCSPSQSPLIPRDSTAGGITEDLTDRGATYTYPPTVHLRKSQDNSAHIQADGCSPSGNSTWKQPGPVEALKQMLFRLQAVEAELQQRHPAAPEPIDGPQTTAKQQLDGEEDFTGTPSLQRALHHLKLLVEEPRERCREDEMEKGQDEGAADELI
ncbi:lung adenoma susceptibility protein 2 isoform X3 [Parambassis ranga]|uniref:Lung adenoma susceptibility protein 2 isoform X3 n=1 Tax=Parambassis ranga TaxID=210632 RepID=A0A6P7JBP8_9TELE|nr:lung adenoma susceptibility protein 2 isoform X3 [Parambassis ranga]